MWTSNDISLLTEILVGSSSKLVESRFFLRNTSKQNVKTFSFFVSFWIEKFFSTYFVFDTLFLALKTWFFYKVLTSANMHYVLTIKWFNEQWRVYDYGLTINPSQFQCKANLPKCNKKKTNKWGCLQYETQTTI